MKFLKGLGVIGVIILGLILVLFAGLYVNNKNQLKKEMTKIAPYGQTVLVDEQEMRVQVLGAGEKTVVLLPGYLTGAPVFDFKPLTDELAANNRVVVIEPFGYGQSADMTKPGTVENLSAEVHSALASLGIKRYTLMAHSISGVYALDYIQRYIDEVEGFVGLDSSLPSQGGAENPTGTIAFLAKSGLYRLFAEVEPTFLNPPPIDQRSLEQFKLISLKTIGSQATLNEGKEMAGNFNKTKDLSYPKNLPVLYFLASESLEPDKEWLPIHQAMINENENGQIIELEGSHYLHHTKAKEISQSFEDFKKTTLN